MKILGTSISSATSFEIEILVVVLLLALDFVGLIILGSISRRGEYYLL